MIEVINPGWLSLAVDNGRYGHADIGVPPSSALDKYSFRALNYLLDNDIHTPAIEVMGNDFSVRIEEDITGAITGAQVTAFLDDTPVAPWSTFTAHTGSLLRVRQVTDGFRYYLGFSGVMGFETAMRSFTTNLECRFGGFKGRPLVRGDRVRIRKARVLQEQRFLPGDFVPVYSPPHVLRIIEGAEAGHFTPKSMKRVFEKTDAAWFGVSAKSNRTGVRLEGEPLVFRKEVEKSIISEGIMAGTIQIPGDGQPIIMLYERTIGGYARLGVVAKVDHDRLAHLRPKDRVRFELIGIGEAERLWKLKAENVSSWLKNRKGG
jgi:biotin-dependent carboxylase-like uncharacterized protein